MGFNVCSMISMLLVHSGRLGLRLASLATEAFSRVLEASGKAKRCQASRAEASGDWRSVAPQEPGENSADRTSQHTPSFSLAECNADSVNFKNLGEAPISIQKHSMSKRSNTTFCAEWPVTLTLTLKDTVSSCSNFRRGPQCSAQGGGTCRSVRT